MPSNPTFRTHPTDHTHLVLPPDAVVLVLAASDAVPMRPPAGAWGLVVVAVRITLAAGAPVRLVGDAPAADPAQTDIAALVAGRCWQPGRPPTGMTGMSSCACTPLSTPMTPPWPTSRVIAATDGVWNTVGVWRSVGARWPHEIALLVLTRMRYLADAAFNDAQWATLTGPIAAALPEPLLPADLIGESAGSPAPRRQAPDTLAALIEAGLLTVGEQLVFDGHTATVREGGVLHDGGPHAFAVSTVSALATA